MRHHLRDTTWQGKLHHLMRLVRTANSGDEIVVRSEAMKILGETYRLEHFPDKEIVWVVEPLQGDE